MSVGSTYLLGARNDSLCTRLIKRNEISTLVSGVEIYSTSKGTNENCVGAFFIHGKRNDFSYYAAH